MLRLLNKGFWIVFLAGFAVFSAFHAHQTHDPVWFLRGLVSFIGAFAVARSAAVSQKNISIHAVTVTFFSVASPFLYTLPAHTTQPIFLALCAIGLAISGWALLDLDEAFGVLPGARSLKTKGAYAVVRHPMYAGYLFASVGWILFAPSALNFSVFLLQCLSTIMRIFQEERLLVGAATGYTDYQMITRYRMLPWVY